MTDTMTFIDEKVCEITRDVKVRYRKEDLVFRKANLLKEIAQIDSILANFK